MLRGVIGKEGGKSRGARRQEGKPLLKEKEFFLELLAFALNEPAVLLWQP
jgi:hypothetical protein